MWRSDGLSSSLRRCAADSPGRYRSEVIRRTAQTAALNFEFIEHHLDFLRTAAQPRIRAASRIWFDV